MESCTKLQTVDFAESNGVVTERQLNASSCYLKCSASFQFSCNN